MTSDQVKATNLSKILLGLSPRKPSDRLGRPLSGSERVQFCKELRSMAEDILLICYVDSRGRTTHVALTEVGRRIAYAMSVKV